MVKVQYDMDGGDSSIEFEGTGINIITECSCIVHHLYCALHKSSEAGAEMFKRIILEEPDHVFCIDEKLKMDSDNLSPEEKKVLRRKSEALHGLLDRLDEALKD